jgi:hypothetical protein
MSEDYLSICWRHLAQSQHIIEDKNAEIARLRTAIRRLAEQDATLSVCDGAITVQIDATLTPEERNAIELGARIADHYDAEMDGFPSGVGQTLRKLAIRIGGEW